MAKRPSARRHWRCISIAAVPTSANSKPKADRAARRRLPARPEPYLPICDWRERQRSPRSEADVAFQNAKTKLIEMRISERERATIPMTEVTETIDQIVGVMLTHLGGMPARVAGHDLQLRRKVEAVVFETRLAISEAAGKMADQRDEPAEPADATNCRPCARLGDPGDRVTALRA